MNRIIALCSIATLALCSGCLTFAGEGLQAIDTTPPATAPTVEQTIGDFQFTLDGGKMITSVKAGRLFNQQILDRWQDRGYISSHAYVKSGAFTGNADYNLTLSGSQYGRSSVFAQILSGLTLLIIPHTVDQNYDVQYTLENVATGEKFSAAVQDSYYTVIELLLFLAFPFSSHGMSATLDVMADHLYQQLYEQGAFGGAREPVASLGEPF